MNLKFYFMNDERENLDNEQAENEQQQGTQQNTEEQKTEAAVRDVQSATDTVKPAAGGGLKNEGTIVSYEEET